MRGAATRDGSHSPAQVSARRRWTAATTPCARDSDLRPRVGVRPSRDDGVVDAWRRAMRTNIDRSDGIVVDQVGASGTLDQSLLSPPGPYTL
jgi:hypothetical protein